MCGLQNICPAKERNTGEYAKKHNSFKLFWTFFRCGYAGIILWFARIVKCTGNLYNSSALFCFDIVFVEENVESSHP